MKSTKLEGALLAIPFLAGAAASVYFFYPGLMTPDPEYQLLQARSFEFGDWHPIIMALIWRPLDMVLPGPFGMLLLFVGMYWTAFYLLTRQLMRQSPVSAALMAALPFAPFLINFVGTIWKDVLVFNCFILAFALIGLQPRRRSPLVLVVAFSLIWIGTLARHNAALAAVPLLCLLFWPAPPDGFARLLGRLTACTILAGALALGTLKLFDLLLEPEHTSAISALFIFDLVGISSRVSTNLVPTSWTPEQSNQILSVCYEPKWWDRIWISCMYVLDQLRASGEWGKLFTAWRSAVAAYPTEYLNHRIAHTATFFQIHNNELIFVSQPTATSFTYGFRPEVTRVAADLVLAAASVPGIRAFFTVGFWLVVANSLVVGVSWLFLRGNKNAYHALMMALSSSFYASPLVLIGVSIDLRYVYYTIGAVCISTILLVSQAFAKSAKTAAVSAISLQP